MTRTVNLNADLGESFGAWEMGSDAEMLATVTSAWLERRWLPLSDSWPAVTSTRDAALVPASVLLPLEVSVPLPSAAPAAVCPLFNA